MLCIVFIPSPFREYTIPALRLQTPLTPTLSCPDRQSPRYIRLTVLSRFMGCSVWIVHQIVLTSSFYRTLKQSSCIVVLTVPGL